MKHTRNRRPRKRDASSSSPVQRTNPRARTPVWVLLLVGCVGAGAVVAVVDFYRGAAVPRPPELDLTDVDPAVARALEAARVEVELAPDSSEAWGRLGMTLMAHGRNVEAGPCLARAAQLDPHEPRWPYLAATAEELDREAALAWLTAAVARRPNNVHPELLLAERHLESGRLDLAERHFEHVRQREPDHPRLHLGLGRLDACRGRWSEAQRHLERATHSPFSRKASWELLAEIGFRAGDRAAAEQAHAQARELPADLPWPDPYYEEVASLIMGREALLMRVAEYHRQGRDEEGRALQRQLAGQWPDVYYLALGRNHVQQRKFDEAERAFRQAIELAPALPDAWLELGQLLLQRENATEADECFQRLVELDPTHADAWRLRGACARAAGRPAEARQFLQTALQYAPHHAAAHRELAELWSELGDEESAEAHRRRAAQIDFQRR